MIVRSGVARHVSVMLGYLYPSLASAKAAVQNDPAAYTQWMTYWVVISVFALLEVFVDFFVSWVPFYYEAKIVLIVWLTLPRYQGASRIYRRLLRPYLEQYEGDIDNGLEGMRVEATRRITSLGASAASEIAKAVTRQSSTAKDQLLSRVLGIAAAAGSAEAPDDRSAVRSAPPPTKPRDVSEGDDHGGSRRREEEEDAAANASMLLEFTGVMKAGLLVQARALFDSDGNDEPWCAQIIRMLHGTTFCMTYSDGGPVAQLGIEGTGDMRFELLAAETESISDRSVLVLRTDRGRVELSLPGLDDHETVLAGFDLLLAFHTPAVSATQAPGDRPAERPSNPTVGRRQSRQWDPSMKPSRHIELDSAEEESEDGSGGMADAPPATMVPLQKPDLMEVG